MNTSTNAINNTQPKPTARGAAHENRGEKLMVADKLQITRKRKDGKEYTTTIATMEEDAQRQNEQLQKEYNKKLRRAEWRKKWMPRIIKGAQIVGILAVMAISAYILFWVILFGFGLMAVGGGLGSSGTRK